MGIPNIYCRLQIDQKKASFAIEIQHQDKDLRAIFYEQIEEFKKLLQTALNTELIWEPHYKNDENIEIARIYKELHGVSVYDKNTWLVAFTFFENIIVPFDTFWEEIKPVFEDLNA
jgi:hypothetical protein